MPSSNMDKAHLLTALTLVQQIVFFALMTVCTYTDIAKNKVYNWATLPAILVGLGLGLGANALGVPVRLSVMSSLIGAGIGGGIFFIFFLLRAIGAGDVKLMAAVGALMGWKFTLTALWLIALVGAVMALGALILRKRLAAGLKSSARMLFTFRRSKAAESEPALTVPYGAAIAIGGMWAWAMLLIFNKLPTLMNP